jgi:hypothetical protein
MVCTSRIRAGQTMKNPLVAAYRYTTNNWSQLQDSKLCGCCNCVQIFPADEVVGWTGLDMNNADDPRAVEQQTAMCPRCGSEAVLGDKSGYPIHAQFLTQMNEAWFQQTLIRPTGPKAP